MLCHLCFFILFGPYPIYDKLLTTPYIGAPIELYLIPVPIKPALSIAFFNYVAYFFSFKKAFALCTAPLIEL